MLKMTKANKRAKNMRRILSVCLLICIIAVGFSLGGCLKTLEWISNLLPESPELYVEPEVKNIKSSLEYRYIPAIYSDTKIFDRNNVKLKLYIGGNAKRLSNRKFVGIYLMKLGFYSYSGVDDYSKIEGWTLLKEYPIEEFESFERTERKSIGGVSLDMYLTEITIPESYFTEERANFYLAVCPIVMDQDTGKWSVKRRNVDFFLPLTYELLPDNKVKVYGRED